MLLQGAPGNERFQGVRSKQHVSGPSITHREIRHLPLRIALASKRIGQGLATIEDVWVLWHQDLQLKLNDRSISVSALNIAFLFCSDQASKPAVPDFRGGLGVFRSKYIFSSSLITSTELTLSFWMRARLSLSTPASCLERQVADSLDPERFYTEFNDNLDTPVRFFVFACNLSIDSKPQIRGLPGMLESPSFSVPLMWRNIASLLRNTLPSMVCEAHAGATHANERPHFRARALFSLSFNHFAQLFFPSVYFPSVINAPPGCAARRGSVFSGPSTFSRIDRIARNSLPRRQVASAPRSSTSKLGVSRVAVVLRVFRTEHFFLESQRRSRYSFSRGEIVSMTRQSRS